MFAKPNPIVGRLFLSLAFLLSAGFGTGIAMIGYLAASGK